MSRWLRSALRVAMALMAGTTLVHAGPAQAQDETTAPLASALGGFEGSAAASGLRVVYNPAGVLPIPPPVDLSSPDAVASIASGPATFARASIADPGDLLANPDPLLANASPDYPAGAIPPYPFRVTASNGSGAPTTRLTPLPGFDASVTADNAGSVAEATTPRATAPAIATVGTARSFASTKSDGTTVTVEASASLSDLNLLGLLVIDSVATKISATSDGRETTTSGGTIVTGASLAGQAVTIDADGIRPTGGASGSQSAVVASANELLAALGLRVTVASPIQQEAPEAGQLASAGLQIDLEVSDRTYPQIQDLLAQLPSLPTLVPGVPGVDDVLALARARNLATVGVGQAVVNLGVRTLESTIDLPIDVPVDLPSSVVSGSFDFDPGSLPSITTDPLRPVASGSTPDPLNPGFAEGIGLVAILGLLLQPLLADRISKGSAFLLAGDPTGACPREGP